MSVRDPPNLRQIGLCPWHHWWSLQCSQISYISQPLDAFNISILAPTVPLLVPLAPGDHAHPEICGDCALITVLHWGSLQCSQIH